ncbi:MAG: iron-sulfur cluster assembly scaffold protein [Gammaproteobacteria bacterium]|nr:iron-sulfur cluster assembly scaffold protein [Gammaproteobacteria bacterium]
MSESIRSRFDSLAGAGRLAGGPGRVLSGQAGSRAQGTEVRFDWRVEAGRILEARFLAYGCPYTLAVCDWLVAQLAGRDRNAPWPGDPEAWAGALGVPLERLGRLLVVEDALKATLRAWNG